MRCRVSTGVYVFLTVVCIQGLASTASGENTSLGRLYPRQKLQSILLSRSRWQPFARAKDRTAWAAIPKPARDKFIHLAEEYMKKDIQALPASLYLEYKRIGNRSNYQDVWLERRKMLHCLVLAECMEGRGRFLDSITNVIWAICEESSWTWPAHVGAQKAGSGLPDTSEPVVALFSAETADSLAWTVYLLREELDTVSPQICKRVDREIDSRILTPYLQRDDFGWMGFSSRSDGRRPNNWNPWINSNVLAAALLIEPDEARRLDLVHKVLRCLDNFLVPYPSDGSCDEGPSYWGHAGASVFDNLDLLYSATGGSLNRYEDPVIQEIGRFIYRAHISDDYFVNIGDCDARLDIYRDLVFRYGRRIGDKKMQDFAACGLTEEGLFEQDKSFRSLARVLHTLFNLPNLLAAKASFPPLLRDVWLGDEDMQMMAARDEEGSTKGLYVACWAAHNGQSHNHNDVGNFIVFADGRPFIVDIGRPTYTRQTFSSDRYEIQAFQSAYHNLPTVNGVMQEAGRSFEAKHVKYEAKEGFAQLTMDIAPAYPSQAGISKWLRTVRLARSSDIQVIDSFELKETPRELTQSLITPCNIDSGKPGEIILKDPRTGTRLMVRYDADKLAVQTEAVNIEDDSLSEAWGTQMSRILLKSKSKSSSDTWTLRFSK